MPLPKPSAGQSEKDWMAKCMGDEGMVSEFPDEAQRAAVCHRQLEGKQATMTTKHQELVEAIRGRKAAGHVSRFGYGIGTADLVVKAALEEIGDGFCKRIGGASGSFDKDRAIKEAMDRLVCCQPDAKVEQTATTANFKSLLPEGIEAPPHTLMVLRYTLTTGRKDRDGDILHPDGAEIDPAGPMLWQHLFNLPIGRMLAVTEKSARRLREIGVLLDLNELTEDCAKLFEAGALRFSHGFQALDWRELKGTPEMKGRSPGKIGFEVIRYEILERSAVSVPSNADAILELASRGKLASEVFRKQAKDLWVKRPTAVRGIGSVEERPIKKTCCGTKVFNVAEEPLEAKTLMYDWIAKYCEAPIKSLSQSSMLVGAPSMGSWLTAQRDVMQRAAIAAVRNIDRDAEVPPGYETIQLNSKQSDEFLTEGTSFFAIDGFKMVVSVGPEWGGLRVSVLSQRKDAAKANAVLGEIDERAKAYRFLKGEAFRASGEFIDRTDETWADVFLTKENEKPLKQIAKQIKDKGATLANRGIIMMGPPGTGKTLSGRVLHNETPGVTFIWISAKDFYRMGAFGGFNYSFELAKSLAPTILFFEDVDNWMDPHVVDLLKSEMDGIGRSKGVVTILTTNEPERLDQALIDRPGRFHDVLMFGHPDEGVRSIMLSKWAADVPAEHRKRIASETEGWSGAHLYELCAFAKTLAESDDEPLGSAIDKSLQKIAEQRQLIQSVQGHGRYRPTLMERSTLVEYVKSMSLKAKDEEEPEEESEAITCPECESEVPEDATECPECGAKLAGEEEEEEKAVEPDATKASKWPDPDTVMVCPKCGYRAPKRFWTPEKVAANGDVFTCPKCKAEMKAEGDQMENETEEEKSADESLEVLEEEIDTKGDLPGHPFHGNQWSEGASGGGGDLGKQAIKLSNKADKLSDKARAAKTPEAHTKAAEAHESARDAHRKAETRARELAKRHEAAGHADKAKYHAERAKFHRKTADDMIRSRESHSAIASQRSKDAAGIWVTVEQMEPICPNCAAKMREKNLKAVNVEALEPDVLQKFLAAKAGRVLSAANVQKLQDCLNDLEELAGMDLPRAAGALAGRIVQTLSALVEAAVPASDEPPTEKQINPLAEWLAKADAAELSRVEKIVQARLAVESLDAKAAEYRKLVAC